MVDWMVEVLTTFKNSDQTFFLAINMMDRFFKINEKPLPAGDLHLTGIVSMFIASKYEEIVPLMMKTVVNKIGHNKFLLRQIEDKELEILRVIGYKVGAPTVKEFLDRFLEELSDLIGKPDK
jgi:Cyclin, N-terminal domain